MIRLYCGQRSVEILRNCMYFEKKRVRDLYSRYVHASVFIGRVLRRVEFILGAPCKSKSINTRGGNAVGMFPSLFFFCSHLSARTLVLRTLKTYLFCGSTRRNETHVETSCQRYLLLVGYFFNTIRRN